MFLYKTTIKLEFVRHSKHGGIQSGLFWDYGNVSGPNLVAIIMLGIEGTKACMLWLVCTLRARPREPTRPQTHCKQPVADWLMTPSSGVTVEIPVLASWTIGEYCGFTQKETSFSFLFFLKSYLGMCTECWCNITFVG